MSTRCSGDEECIKFYVPTHRVVNLSNNRLLLTNVVVPMDVSRISVFTKLLLQPRINL